MIVRNREYMQEPVPVEMLNSVLAEYQQGQERRKRLEKAYNNDRDILQRTRPEGKPNNRLAHGFPRYIVTMASGYLLGGPVTYRSDDQAEQLQQVMDAYNASDMASVDIELARQASIYGKSVEMTYADEDAQPCSAALDPKAAFVVYDDTVAHKPMFGVTYSVRTKVDGTMDGFKIVVCTDQTIYTYFENSLFITHEPDTAEQHYFGAVPIVEFWNDENEKGDFEQVETLIDAYDTLESDRINDKEQFVDSILVMTGVRMENEYETVTTHDAQGNVVEEQRISATPAQQLRRDKLLFLPDSDAKAEYLSRAMAENDVEVLKDALNQDIHKFSLIPDLTDENFAANASGVAMKYKLLGLEQLTKIKEKWFREALRQRLRLFCHFLSVKGNVQVDADKVKIVFTRALPINELETAQTLTTYKGLVPDSQLIAQVPFVDDPDQAAKDMLEQKANEAEIQRKAFGGYNDVPQAELQ